MSWIDSLGETIGGLGELAVEGVKTYNTVENMLDDKKDSHEKTVIVEKQTTQPQQVVNAGIDTKTVLIAGGVVLGAITLIAVMK